MQHGNVLLVSGIDTGLKRQTFQSQRFCNLSNTLITMITAFRIWERSTQNGQIRSVELGGVMGLSISGSGLYGSFLI